MLGDCNYDNNVVASTSTTPLSIADGGTGASVLKVNLPVDMMNVTSDSGTTCTYYPYLKMCFLRAYLVLENGLNAGSPMGVIWIDGAYRPGSITALAAYSTKQVSASIRRNPYDSGETAEVRIMCNESLPAGTAVYVSGWFNASYM